MWRSPEEGESVTQQQQWFGFGFVELTPNQRQTKRAKAGLIKKRENQEQAAIAEGDEAAAQSGTFYANAQGGCVRVVAGRQRTVDRGALGGTAV